MTYEPQKADLIFFKSKSFLGRLIRFFTRAHGEEKTFSNHVGGLTSHDVLLESNFTTIRRPFNIKYESNIEIYRYVGPIPTTDWDEKIIEKANEYVGQIYGFGKFITHLLDASLVKIFKTEIFFFRKLNHLDRYPICSWVWAYAYYKGMIGYEFGINPKYASPDDMHDFVKSSTEWELVYKG